MAIQYYLGELSDTQLGVCFSRVYPTLARMRRQYRTVLELVSTGQGGSSSLRTTEIEAVLLALGDAWDTPAERTGHRWLRVQPAIMATAYLTIELYILVFTTHAAIDLYSPEDIGEFAAEPLKRLARIYFKSASPGLLGNAAWTPQYLIDRHDSGCMAVEANGIPLSWGMEQVLHRWLADIAEIVTISSLACENWARVLGAPIERQATASLFERRLARQEAQ